MFLTRSEVADYLDKHDHYCILTHRRPDGDTVGSAVGLCLALRSIGKDASVLYNPEITPKLEPLMEGVTVKEPGEGNIIINDRELNKYFGLKTLELIVNQPLEVTETKGKYDVLVNVNGGGISGQAGAIRHGISRALLLVDEEFRSVLKKAGFLTRDPREKERRKYGLKKARKASQFSKR